MTEVYTFIPKTSEAQLRAVHKYYMANKDKIYAKKKKYAKIKIICECGKLISKATLQQHKRGLKHNLIINDINYL